MSSLEIALIIIGIIIIFISCRLVDKKQKAEIAVAGKPISLETALTENDKMQLMDKMKEMLSEVSEEIIVRTDDSLSSISNEKIMAVNEFSDQILEKINRNHEEVVFLYNMLNDKEKELKAVVKEIDASKKKVQEIMELKANTAKSEPVKNVKSQANVKPVAEEREKAVKKPIPKGNPDQELPVLQNLSMNNNEQILALYSKGKSIMEISKLLSLGQGEVKLVIDLFKGKK